MLFVEFIDENRNLYLVEILYRRYVKYIAHFVTTTKTTESGEKNSFQKKVESIKL